MFGCYVSMIWVYKICLSILDEFALPWPLRILESEQCIVELQMMSSVDLESSRKTINHRATLHWYGQDGQRKRLDLRKLIRLKLREVSYFLLFYTLT